MTLTHYKLPTIGDIWRKNMSSTELHTGTLTPLKTINSHQEFMDFVHENKLTAWLYPNIEEYFEERSVNDVANNSLAIVLCKSDGCRAPYEYVFYKNVIYKIDNYLFSDDDFYINRFIKNSDGSINFVSMFYNGGTGFDEELQEGLDKLLNKENTNECR